MRAHLGPLLVLVYRTDLLLRLVVLHGDGESASPAAGCPGTAALFRPPVRPAVYLRVLAVRARAPTLRVIVRQQPADVCNGATATA